jgi:hypothetical protein
VDPFEALDLRELLEFSFCSSSTLWTGGIGNDISCLICIIGMPGLAWSGIS